jgi:hypothetical protein
MLLLLSVVLICVTNVKLRVEFCILYCVLFETCKLILIKFYFQSTLFFMLQFFSHEQLIVGKGTDGFTAISKISVACVWPRREEFNVCWNSQKHAVCIVPSTVLLHSVFIYYLFFRHVSPLVLGHLQEARDFFDVCSLYKIHDLPEDSRELRLKHVGAKHCTSWY